MSGNGAPPDTDRIRTETGRICGELAHLRGALLPILNAVQAEFGYVPPESVPVIARHQNLSRAEVHGVISFYHLYRDTPAGEHIVYLCCAESCQAAGGLTLAAHARARLGVDLHGTTGDGRFTLEPIYCLGNCACSPAVMVDETLHGRVTPEAFDRLLAETDA